MHLVPYDGTGGVEIAARSMAHISDGEIVFDVAYIFAGNDGGQGRSGIYNPLSLLKAAWKLVRCKPDLLIVSLWRSCIVGILFKLFSPRSHVVVFLHLPQDVHWLDAIATRLAMWISTEVWADSEATLASRAPATRPCRSISFVTQRLSPLPRRQPAPEFAFWGRINAQKGLDRALGLFARIRANHPDARFRIIGPDGGALDEITNLIAGLGLSDAVKLAGERKHEEIPHAVDGASFYLQTSLTEGMAMSVVEAMQMGLVPVVTPVGEIGNYCRNGINSIVVVDEAETERRIESLLRSPEEYRDMSVSAIATWQDRRLYRDDVLSACKDILKAIG